MPCTAEDLYQALLDDSRELVEHATGLMLARGEEGLGAPRAAGWTRAEELCHLWEGAQVNHLRLLWGVAEGGLVFPRYDQDGWVAAQAPGVLPWDLLAGGWRADTLRLLHLAGRLDPAARTAPRARHNLCDFGWQPHPADLPASLEDLIRDFLGHLRHHLRRLAPDLVPPPRLPAGLGRPALPRATARLALRPLAAADLEDLAPILADPEVVRHLPGPPRSHEHTARTIAHFAAHQERHGFSAWAVLERESGRLAGWCGLAELDGTGEVELLYCLGRHAWGRGLATEAALTCTAAARDEVGLPRLVAVVVPENAASRGVLAKCGLTPRRPARHFGLDLEWWQIEFH